MGETEKHLGLKALALAWAREQGMTIAAGRTAIPVPGNLADGSNRTTA